MKTLLKLYKNYKKNTKQAVYLCIEIIDNMIANKQKKIGYNDPVVIKENKKLIIVRNYF